MVHYDDHITQKYKVDRLVEENAALEKLMDVVVVDVRIVSEDLMALKMRLLMVDAVVKLIEDDMDMGVGMDVVELAMLIGSGLLMLWRWWRLPRTRCSSGHSVSNGSKHHTYLVGGRLCTKTTRR